MVINSILGTLYYNVIIAWALFYFILSFRKTLLWGDCGHWWNSKQCFVPGSQTGNVIMNGTALNCTESFARNLSVTECLTATNTTGKVAATEEFF